MTATIESLASHSIVVAGHSHARALVGRLECESIEVKDIEGAPNIFDYCGPWPRTDAYWQGLAKAPRNTTIALLWCGNEHNAHFMFRPAPMFDFYIKQLPNLIPDKTLELVPEALVRERLSMFMGDLENVLTYLRDNSAANVVVVGSPPPKGDAMKLKALIASEWYFREKAKQLGADIDTIEITPPWLRLKLYRLLQQMFLEKAEQCGATYLPVPDDVTDGAGFLKEEYWDSDATHANRDYGKRMLNHLADQYA
jgi:hypothetical protein